MKPCLGLALAAVLSVAATAAAAQTADLSITMTDGATTITPGAVTTYTITVANSGPDAATNAALSYSLPAAFTVVTLSAPWTCVAPMPGASGVINCTTPTMPSGASDQITVQARLSASVAPGSSTSNTVTVTSATADPSPGNNSATDTNTVVAAPVAAVPTLTEWAMILFGGLLASGAALHLQRRRRRHMA